MPRISINSYNPVAVNSRMNLQAFSDSLNKLDARHKEALAQRTAIRAAIAELDLNEAEDEYRANLINQVQNRIDAQAQYGSYANALTEATMAAGDIASNLGLKARVKAQAEYKNYVDTIQKRPDLTEDDKAWALAQNPYHYEDRFDSAGNVIGGTAWKPNNSPVGEIDFNKILAQVKSLVFQETGQSTDVKFVDENGNETSDLSQAVQAMYKTTRGWNGISREKLNNLLEAAIDNTPGARARIDQDWEVLNWKYNTGRIDDSDRELFAENGKKYSKRQWYNNRFGRAINSMSGMNYTSDVTYDQNYWNFKQARMNAAALAGTEGENSNGTSFLRLAGTPIEDIDDTANKAAGAVIGTISQLEDTFKTFKNNPTWIAAKNSNDYKTLLRILNKLQSIMSPDDNRYGKLNQYITDLNNNAEIVQNNLKYISDPQAYMFNAAFATGGDLPANNKYTSEYMKEYNKFVGDGKTLRYLFNDNREARLFGEVIGLNLDDNDSNLLSTYNNRPAISLDADDIRNYKGMSIYDNMGYDLASVHSVRENGSVVTRDISILANSILSPSNTRRTSYYKLVTIPRNTESITKRDIGANAGIQKTYTAKVGSLPGIDALRVQRDSGIINDATYKSRVNDMIDEYLTALYGSDFTQLKMAVLDEEGNVYKFVDSAERRKYMDAIQSRLAGNQERERLLTSYVYNDKVGLQISIPKNINKSKGTYIAGEVPETRVVIFNINDNRFKRLEQETNFRGSNKYNKLRQFGNINNTFFDGSSISWSNKERIPKFTDVDGKQYSLDSDAATSLFGREEGYNDIKQAIITGNMANATRLFNAWYREYYNADPSTPAAQGYFKAIVSKIINELK